MNLLRRIFHSTALLGLAALGARAAGQTQNYAPKTKTINAAVLLLDSDKPSGTYVYGQTAAPFAFYNLDAATGIKPDNWSFVNPYASGYYTHDLYLRFKELGDPTVTDPDNVSSGTPPPVIPITKRQAAYWTTRLSSLSESQIANYNVLLIAPRYQLSLNSRERELLRRFVDGGGVLWVDLGSAASFGTSGTGGIDSSNNLPLGVSVTNTGNIPVSSYGSSPVLNAVRSVTDFDLTQLNSLAATQGFWLSPVNSTAANDAGIIGEYYRYQPVVLDNTSSATNLRPVVAQARLGDGAIVVTARGVAEILNRGSITNAIDTNSGATDNPLTANLGFLTTSSTLDPTAKAAARLALNITTLGGEGLQPSGSTRKMSSAVADTPAPVLSRFNTEQPAGSSDTGYGYNNAISWSTPPNAPPVVYKGFLVATVGQKIVVMDAVPGRDLDGDGDPDDGIADLSGATVDAYRDSSLGKPLDVIWVSDDLGAQLSAPVCAQVPEINKTTGVVNNVDQILVTDANGRLHAFALAPVAASNYRLIGGVHTAAAYELKFTVGSTTVQYPLSPPSGSGGHVQNNSYYGTTPLPPVVVDGLAYVADSVSGTQNQGRVWVVDLSTGQRLQSTNSTLGTTNDWYLGTSLNLPDFTAEPTVGYVPIEDNSGGVDRVMYTPSIFPPYSQPGFASLWLGAKGEVPDSWAYDQTTNTLKVTTRAAAAGGIPIYVPPTGTTSPVLLQLSPHVTITDQNGNPLRNMIATNAVASDQGVLTFTTNAATTSTDWDSTKVAVRVDYTIDWGYSPTSQLPQILRGSLKLPVYKNGVQPDGSKRIMGPIALTPQGTMHLVEGTPANLLAFTTPSSNQGGDSYFAIREDAGLRGQFRVVSRYTLYSQYNQTFGASAVGTFVPAVFNDADVVQKFMPGYTATQNVSTSTPASYFNTFQNFRFTGGVSVRNGIAYTAISAQRGTGTLAGVIPVAIVAAFKAEPESAELHLNQTVPTNPWLQQTDWARSTPGAIVRTPTSSTLSGASVVVDNDNETIRIENLATVVNGEITDCLSESQPLGVGSTSQTLSFRQPDALGDRWSPLLWFGLWNGATPTGTPFLGGNEVYLPAQSVLPSLLTSGTLTPSGVVWAIDGDAPSSGPYTTTLANTNRPWINQQVQIIQTDPTNNANAVAASPYYRMPQIVGISSFQDFQARLNQTQLGTSTTVAGLGGGDGVVTAFTDKGLYGLSRSDLVICDEGRLLQVDSAGNPETNTFGARFSGVGNGGSVANQRQLPRPVKAYPVGTSDTLVVDAGGNRVMRLAADGTVLRSIDRIQLDPVSRPASYRVNEPLTFNDPRDAATFEGYVYKGTTDVVKNQQAVEYWIHYLIADSGNGRLVELIDRFAVDPTSGRILAPITLSGTDAIDPETGLPSTTPIAQVGVLAWQSPSLEGAANAGDYYNSVSRVFLGTTTNGRYVYVAGVSRNRPTRVSAGLDNPQSAKSLAAGGGGAVVVFDPVGGTRVFDRFAMPDTRSAAFFTPASATTPNLGSFTTATNANQPVQRNRPFRGVQAVTAESVFVNGQASVRTMVTDEDAIYEFDLDARVLGNAGADTSVDFSGNPVAPRWMLTETAFTSLRSPFVPNSTTVYDVSGNALSFRPSYARRLDSGEVIVVNGYQGKLRDLTTAYTGEVVMLDGRDVSLAYSASDTTTRNLGFTFNNVRLDLKTLTGIRGLVSPVFADRR